MSPEIEVQIALLKLKIAENNLNISNIQSTLKDVSESEQSIRRLEILTLLDTQKELQSQLETLTSNNPTPNLLDEFNLPLPPTVNQFREVKDIPEPPLLQTSAQDDFLPEATSKMKSMFINDLPTPPHNTSFSSFNLIKPHVLKPGEDISTFLERFEQFITLSGIKDIDLHLYALSLIQDESLYRRLKSIHLSNHQKHNATLLVEAYNETLFPATETRILRSSLASLKQKPSESISSFILRIDKLASKAHSNKHLRDEASISTFISGLSDTDIKRKLLAKNLTSFSHATEVATKYERIAETIATVPNNYEEEKEFPVLRVSSTNRSHHQDETTQQRFPNKSSNHSQHHSMRDHRQLICFTCNEPGHVAYDCPHRKYGTHTSRNSSTPTCFKCGVKGHYASSCPDRQPSRQPTPTHSQPTPPTINTDPTPTVNAVGKNHILVNAICTNVSVNMFLDCGSSVSLVSSDFVKRINQTSSIKPSTITLSSFTENKINTQGIITLSVDLAGISTNHNFYVTQKMDTDFLLGMDFLSLHGVTLDLNNNILRTAAGTSKIFSKPHSEPRTLKIKAKQTTIIPPNTMMFIRGKIPSSNPNTQGVDRDEKSSVGVQRHIFPERFRFGVL